MESQLNDRGNTGLDCSCPIYEVLHHNLLERLSDTGTRPAGDSERVICRVRVAKKFAPSGFAQKIPDVRHQVSSSLYSVSVFQIVRDQCDEMASAYLSKVRQVETSKYGYGTARRAVPRLSRKE
ncbi:hypothetical protein WCE37_01010 [Luteimonas sp. MJ250]|uniref:hypothetical protein n=1 Tax=Luteimonas sp. MJ250 TaxID=3129236 RepID=UPI0031BAC89A